jgi:hypothetical protein
MKSSKKPQSVLEVIREVAMTTGGSSAAIAAALEARLGTGFVEGLELLGTYAQRDMVDGETALDAEAEAVALSRQLMRPVLEKKLQRRVDELDQGTSKKKRRRVPAAK